MSTPIISPAKFFLMKTSSTLMLPIDMSSKNCYLLSLHLLQKLLGNPTPINKKNSHPSNFNSLDLIFFNFLGFLDFCDFMIFNLENYEERIFGFYEIYIF